LRNRCSQMLKVYSFGEKSSMESNNSYNQLCHTTINSGYVVVDLAL
jgi:hypothetical protein